MSVLHDEVANMCLMSMIAVTSEISNFSTDLL